MSESNFDAKVPDQIVTGKGETLVRRKGQTEFQKTTVKVRPYSDRCIVTEALVNEDLDMLMHSRLFGAGSPRQGGKTETLRQFMKRIDKKK